jgi:hypothetical protein
MSIPAKLKKSQANGSAVIDFDTDTLKCLLVVAGSGAPSVTKSGVQFVSDVTGTNAEVTGTGYARQTLSGVTVDYNASTDVVEFSFSAITFSQNAAGFTNARYLVFYKDVGGADSTRPVFDIQNLTSDRSVVGGDLVLTPPAGGTINW